MRLITLQAAEVQQELREEHARRDTHGDTSLIRNRTALGPYIRAVPRALWWSKEGGAFYHERGTPVTQEVQEEVQQELQETFRACGSPAGASGGARLVGIWALRAHEETRL